MRCFFRSWPRGLVLFLQPARMNPFGRAEKDHAEEERRDHEYLKNNKQKRINAAAVPKVRECFEGFCLGLDNRCRTAPDGHRDGRKRINGGC